MPKRQRVRRSGGQQLVASMVARPGEDPYEGVAIVLQLPEEQRTRVDSMLRRGASTLAVAVFLQKELRVGLSMSKDAMGRMLRRYREAYIVNPLRDRLAENIELRHGTIRSLDTLEELQALALVQRQRLMAAMTREEPTIKTGMLLGMVGAELERYQKLVKDIAWLQLETGILRRVSPTIRLAAADEVVEEGTQWQKMQEAFERGDDVLSTIEGEFRRMAEGEAAGAGEAAAGGGSPGPAGS